MSIHTELIEPLRPDARAVLCYSSNIKQTWTEFTGLLEGYFWVTKSCHHGFDAVKRLFWPGQNVAFIVRGEMGLNSVVLCSGQEGQFHSVNEGEPGWPLLFLKVQTWRGLWGAVIKIIIYNNQKLLLFFLHTIIISQLWNSHILSEKTCIDSAKISFSVHLWSSFPFFPRYICWDGQAHAMS